MSIGPAKHYVAQSTSAGVEVLVQHSAHLDDTSPLQQLGGAFEWGYEGAGPTRLAYALLADVVAERFGQAFMKDVISRTSPIEKHEKVVVFHEVDILKWLREQLNSCDLCV